MKSIRVLVFLVILTLLAYCSEKDEIFQPYINHDITACGVNDPLNNLPWLNEIVTLANSDETGNYLGTIWLKEYESQEFFVTNMMLGSGGLMYWTFNCSGEFDPVGDSDFYNSFCDCEIIYSNLPENIR